MIDRFWPFFILLLKQDFCVRPPPFSPEYQLRMFYTWIKMMKQTLPQEKKREMFIRRFFFFFFFAGSCRVTIPLRNIIYIFFLY